MDVIDADSEAWSVAGEGDGEGPAAGGDRVGRRSGAYRDYGVVASARRTATRSPRVAVQAPHEAWRQFPEVLMVDQQLTAHSPGTAGDQSR